MANNKPIKVFRAAGVKASVFENQNTYNGKQSTIFRIAIDKSYKDRSTGEWKSTNSFSASTELPLAILVLSKAYEFVAMKEATNGNSNAVKEEDIR